MTRVLAVAGLAASVALPFSTRVRAAQVVVPAQERFVEPLSQLSFPLEVQGWSRRRVLRYPDPAGHSVTYELKIGSELKSTATVYVYPHGPLWPPTVREHFLATVDELRSTSRASELITQQTIPAGAGDVSRVLWKMKMA